MKDVYTRLLEYDYKKYKFISNYIIAYEDLENLTSKIIQDDCHVSASTITKFVQSLGYNHFLELKYALIFSTNAFAKIEKNTLLPLFIDPGLIQDTAKIIQLYSEAEHIYIASDINNINLASELFEQLSMNETKEILHIRSSYVFETLKKKQINHKSLVLFLGTFPNNIEYIIPEDENLLILNISTKEEQTFKPVSPRFDYVSIEAKEGNPISSRQTLFFYICFLSCSLK